MTRTLEERLEAAKKTIGALTRRVEERLASGESAFAVLEQSVALERLVAERTSQLGQKQAQLEESLRQNREAQLALTLAQEVAHTGNWIWNVATGEVACSEEYCRMLGLSPATSRMTLDAQMQLVHPNDRASVQALLDRALRERGQFESEYRILRADGQVRFTYGRGRVLIDAEEQLTMIGTAQDITELKEMQARLSVAERMASLGTLAGGAAHEIMNPLAYASSNVSFVADQLAGLEAAHSCDGIEELRKALGEASCGLDRIRRVVENLRAFSHGDRQAGLVDIGQAVDLAIKMASSEIGHRARLVRDFRPVRPVEGDVSQLGQVFLNLLVNAAQAIQTGRPDENEIRILMQMQDAEHAVVEIRDTGCGMPPQIKSRVFDPFFTTRPVGSGMGLGLSICHGIVRALGGEIFVESEVGRGSTFRVVLRSARSFSVQDAGDGAGTRSLARG